MSKKLCENSVREAAYYLWKNAGSPAGQDEYFWSLALEQYNSSCSSASCSNKPTRKAPAKKAAVAKKASTTTKKAVAAKNTSASKK